MMREGELNKQLKDPVYALKVELAGKQMEIDKLKDELAECRAMLKRVEWDGYHSNDNCPVCYNEENEGHKPDCELKKILDKTDPPIGENN